LRTRHGTGAASASNDLPRRIRRALGARLAQLRKQRRLTQRAVAARLGTSQTLLSRYERGIHAPSYATLLRLRHLYAVSLDYLLAGAARGEIRDPRLHKLALTADALPPDHRTLVVTTLQSLIGGMQADVRRGPRPNKEP
jgi:transcriptional regulator with XRE-family HTH domain